MAGSKTMRLSWKKSLTTIGTLATIIAALSRLPIGSGQGTGVTQIVAAYKSMIAGRDINFGLNEGEVVRLFSKLLDERDANAKQNKVASSDPSPRLDSGVTTLSELAGKVSSPPSSLNANSLFGVNVGLTKSVSLTGGLSTTSTANVASISNSALGVSISPDGTIKNLGSAVSISQNPLSGSLTAVNSDWYKPLVPTNVVSILPAATNLINPINLTNAGLIVVPR